ncbi:MAG: acyl-CoA thioesterase [Pseudomonadota bacterium]|nr:acyl-CoA thioesterase [Pseudomonadota bacterium]
MSFESSSPTGNTTAAAAPAASAETDTRALHGQLPADKELVLKVIPMPRDCNPSGDIFGGWVMAQVDLAGAVLPARHVNGRMVTVAVNQFIFKQPVRVGDILSFFASVTRIGTTSITVQVEVFAEDFRAQGRYFKVTEASLTYVALDEAGKPRKIAQPARAA